MSIDGAAPSPVPDSRYAPLLIPLAAVMVGLLVVFFVIFNYATVSGPSMRPTLLSDDRLLLTRSYTTPRRGDIIVFTHSVNGEPPEEIVKRVVGLPGDTVQMRGDLAVVNGVAEAAGPTLIVGAEDVGFGPQKVPAGMLFVLGDNRPVSLDSRFIGFIPMNEVKGRAVAIFTPVTRIRSIPGGP